MKTYHEEKSVNTIEGAALKLFIALEKHIEKYGDFDLNTLGAYTATLESVHNELKAKELL